MSEQGQVSDVFKSILRHINNPLYVSLLLIIIATVENSSNFGAPTIRKRDITGLVNG
jgi:site-specific DNA-cytosine methylase